MCSLSIGGTYAPGDYEIRVASDSGKVGENSFSLRAAFINSDGSVNATASAGINLFAGGRLTLQTVTSGSPETFYLVRLPSSQAGQSMQINLFDVGDADEPGTLQIIPPSDATSAGGPMSAFSGCQIVGPKPKSSSSTTSSNCTVSGLTYDSGNGQMMEMTIPVPADYVCNDLDPLGCWIKVTLQYPGGEVYDTTSWQVKMDAAPVRLVPNSQF